eukprot:CAMPEP_0201709156 /NCGR_PEP_ID=MMETSP0578-20130828/57949_1 /ASSEMBLY_ACC=CAM_ASM_000663 /TAXON_ID=267565 /ORGANISM="Skeletonema grethea, Strain CCMP 1804" /LENGTH=438 /DNA_ID=CAMNT_0048198107 /DNA_START=377 /DNA_END=1693 /DNA_ORIENTATION=+
MSNKDNSIDNVGSGNCLLLQPQMDARKYGFAKIVKARRGQTVQQGSNNAPKSKTTSSKINGNDVGMAMEVLRFVHMQLGGDADDDLHHYYLGTSEEGEDSTNDNSSSIGVAAGRHSEGHYTQFLDEDEELSDDLTGTYGDAIEKGTDVNEDGTEEDELEFDESILASTNDLMNAVRIAFRAPLVSPTPSNEETLPKQTIIQRRHKDAIDVSNLLSEQLRMWSGKSSISVDVEQGVRVVATSTCLMRSSSGVGVSGLDKKSYKFAYRIRVENIADLLDSKEQPPKGDDSSESSVEHRAIQLLGRTWRISECRLKNQEPSSVLQRLLEDGALTNKDYQEDETQEELKEVQVVNEPRTGAVGHLPVLGPGEVFEYMSGAELSTPTGQMEGCFHMAKVDMQLTDSAHVGNPVEALSWASHDERRFEAKVGRFGFLVDDYNEG